MAIPQIANGEVGVSVRSKLNAGLTVVYRGAALDQSGAVGDGTTDDTTAYQAAQALGLPLRLPAGKTFKVGSSVPTSPLYGEGALKFGTQQLDGYYLKYYPQFDTIAYSPDAMYLVNGSNLPGVYPPAPPTGAASRYHNAIFTIGSNFEDGTNPVVIRSSLFGTFNGVRAKSWDRVDAFGHCTLMFSEFAERSSGLGSDTFPWLGISSRQVAIDTNHNFYRNGTPGTSGWEFQSTLEAAYPGIGQRIYDWATFHTVDARASFDTGLGRDAGANIVYGNNNTFGGYSSAAYMYAGSGNTIFGVNAGQNAVFGDNLTLYGYRAGKDLMDADGTVALGKDAAFGIKQASRSLFLGPNAGSGLTGNQDDTLAIANQGTTSSQPLISGKFFNATTRLFPGVGINISPGDIKRTSLHVRYDTTLAAAIDPSTDAAGILITRNGNTGLTVQTPNTAKGSLFFGDTDAADIGGVMYDHSNDRINLRSGGVYRLILGASGYFWVSAFPTAAPAAGSKQVWCDTANGNVLKYAA